MKMKRREFLVRSVAGVGGILIGSQIAAAGEKLGGAEVAAEETSAPAEAEAKVKITDLDGVGPKVEKALIAAGYDTVEKVKNLTVEDLTALDGIGKKTAEKILKSAKG